MKKIIATVLLLSAFLPSFAQTGTVRGTVTDRSNGEPLFGVAAVVAGTTKGAVTDFDGKFEFQLEPGVYNLQFSFVSFERINITDVVVDAGEVTVLHNIMMNESVETLEAVVVSAEAIRSSETALLTVKRKSPALMDGISAASFDKIGDSDAGDAVKRVTGVSVEGGKYVFVRGLGDRYTKTMLNNVDIPGLDPDRNSLQIDIFPTSLLNNMMVAKSFTADMPADFTGGMVNIETKDFPDERIFDISVSTGFNPSMHFNDNYLSYKGSSTDWLGFDDGQRSLPQYAKETTIPTPLSAIGGQYTEQEVNTFVNSFDPNMAAQRSTSFMDYGVSATYGDQTSVGSGKLGYIFSLSYKNSTKYYDDVVYGEYQLSSDLSRNELQYSLIQDGERGESNVLLAGLAGLAYKTHLSKYKLMVMHLQNGESTAMKLNIDNDGDAAIGQSGYQASADNLSYNQRGLTNVMLNGEHNNSNGNWNVEWKLASTFSNMVDPDIRRTAFTITPSGNSVFSPGAGGYPSRTWRYLDEVNLVGKIDVARKYMFLGEDAKVKFGVSHVYKQRDYEILTYNMQFFGSQPDFGGDPDKVLEDQYIYPNGPVYFQTGNNTPNPNAYNSNLNNTAFYISNEFNPLTNLKAIVGLRAEKFTQRHTGRDIEYASFGENGNGNNLDNEKVLDALDLFPTVNLVYSLTETMNLRGSYSRTIARPSFKELSFAQIIDPMTNRIFDGGLYAFDGSWDGNLHESNINNFDLRWETYMQQGQILSVSAFYKTFQDPIELVRIPLQATSTEYQPRNVGDGTLFGLELEFRKNLDFIAQFLESFSINGNMTLVKSEIQMTDTEYVSRVNNARDGQTIENTRPMAGQAPYILNGGIGYDNSKLGMDVGLFYNVRGATLTIVGGGIFPDIYEQPFHSLNFNLNKSFGINRKSSVSFGIDNILNSERRVDYTGYKASNQPYTRYSPGTSFNVSYKLSI
ncbi:TonB-dependent receptor [Reichenbachiella agarivorans]|uniref:TonB-dependent receptor n=1 Tax=Reichenbachiella agarivorans TaxID=2979464 RepID=A0ABY6CJ94_9BACT|nr:TonB-dependent receptor [Reichenbachiella agarivorans]UXP30590.1 TonB-dependent receptor [Reichenbachiella agarivorans]